MTLSAVFVSQAQMRSVHGVVKATDGSPLIGATIQVKGTLLGTTTDAQGQFALTTDTSYFLIVTYSGYVSDTLQVKTPESMQIVLAESTEELSEVIVKASGTFMDNLDAKHVEVITQAELAKAACCNLSESFETNASVDVSFTDAVTGAKVIQVLGLDGSYVQINRENMPNVRGLAVRYGLSYVPGTWIQSIDVGKGAGTVVNGFESMSGQINVELKKPSTSEKVYLNTYVNSFGRFELNANHARRMNDRWSAALFFHSNYFNRTIDQNDDGFMDLPRSKQVNVLNRFAYQSEKVVSQINWNFMRDEKAGGQVGFGFGDDFRTSPAYGFVNNTTRLELFGKTGLLFPHKPYKGWGFLYSATFLDIDGGFGRNNYQGNETTFYGNMIYQNILGNTSHQYKTGTSILVDRFDEVYAVSVFARNEIVPGFFFEYSYLPSDKLTLLVGARVDEHNLYGTYFTPRLHGKFELTESTALRAAIGKGYRTPNAIMENISAFVSSRQLLIEENPTPEISWNMGASLVSSVGIADRDLNIVVDYFYTTFINQMIFDLDQEASAIHLYNLDGTSFAHSMQVEVSHDFSESLELKSAFKYYDIKTTINDELQDAPYNARHRFFVNGSYATKYDRWKADLTIHWYGSKRLPDTSSLPSEHKRASFSPSYFHVNTQISRGYRWGNVYIGSENLLGFTQNNPIIDPENPFGDVFDASIVWGPVTGRMIYAGIKWRKN